MMMPSITLKPEIVSPEFLLLWPQERPGVGPNLMEPTANYVHDVHARFSHCDLILSSSGNYHMALNTLWTEFLNKHTAELGINSWCYTTSPPLAVSQIQHEAIQLGNIQVSGSPQVVVGPSKLMQTLKHLDLSEGPMVPVLKSRGNVLFIRKGNPKNINSIWDLANHSVRVVTPNPDTEPGTFDNFVSTFYHVALNDMSYSGVHTAEALFNSVFNTTDGHHRRWVSGQRIMHREIPWAINAGKADVAILFYHLALYCKRTFPKLFDFLPLGGTADSPQPLPGNEVEVLYATRIQGQWSNKQLAARDALMQAFSSSTFDQTLLKHGLLRA